MLPFDQNLLENRTTLYSWQYCKELFSKKKVSTLYTERIYFAILPSMLRYKLAVAFTRWNFVAARLLKRFWAENLIVLTGPNVKSTQNIRKHNIMLSHCYMINFIKLTQIKMPHHQYNQMQKLFVLYWHLWWQITWLSKQMKSSSVHCAPLLHHQTIFYIYKNIFRKTFCVPVLPLFPRWL